MSIEARIVCDGEGQITENNFGTIHAKEYDGKKDPYTFYAVTANGTDKQDITLVLPVGGELSGLFRFPRVGEKVLVEMGGTSGSGNYLLGYIPSSEKKELNFVPDDVEGEGNSEEKKAEDKQKKEQLEKDKLLEDGKGMVFRYQQTGKKQDKAKKAGEQYSEIGFYHEKTMWKTAKESDSENSKENFKEVVKINASDEAKGACPKIDKIHIHSTGDIKTNAANHQLITAKRMEILSDCPEIDHLKDSDTEGKLPLGDVKGDDSALHRGDIHIRAGKRVVIKAAKQIELQVGRTVLSIDDKGFNVTTRKINSNWPNSFDTSLTLNPRSGITMFGQGVNITSAYSTQIGDSLGGGLTFSSGAVSLSGREIQLGTQGKAEYLWLLAAAALEQVVNTGMVGAARADDDPAANSAIAAITLVKDDLKTIKELALEFYDLYKKASELRFRKKLKELKDKLAGLDKTDVNYEVDRKKLQDQYRDAIDWQEKQNFKDAKADMDKRKQDDWTLTDESLKDVATQAAALTVMAKNKQTEADAAEQEAQELAGNANASQKDKDAAKKKADDLKKDAAQRKQQADQANSDAAQLQAQSAQRKAEAAESKVDTAKFQANQDTKKAAAAGTAANEAETKAKNKETAAEQAEQASLTAQDAAANETDPAKKKNLKQDAKQKADDAQTARREADEAAADAAARRSEALNAQAAAGKANEDLAQNKLIEEQNRAEAAKFQAEAAQYDAAAHPGDQGRANTATTAEAKAKAAQDQAGTAEAAAKKAKAQTTIDTSAVDNNKAQTAMNQAKENLSKAEDALQKSPNDQNLKDAVQAAKGNVNAAEKSAQSAQRALDDARVAFNALP
jgi:hypothetical protein